MMKPTLACILSVASAAPALAADFSFVPPITTPLPEGHTPTAVRAADLDADGTIDLVVPGRNWNGDPEGFGRVSVLKGQGNGTFTQLPDVLALEGSTEDVAIVDVSGDGKVDLLISVSGRRHRMAIAKGNGDGTFATPVYVDVERQPRGIGVGDLDGDGDTDAALVNHTAASVQVLRNNDPGTLGFAVSDTRRLCRYIAAIPYPIGAAVRDMTSDGRRDLVVTTIGGSRVSVAAGTEGGFAPTIDWKPQNLSGESPAVIGSSIADYDNDGDLDVALPVLLITQTQKVIILRNDGVGDLASQSAFDLANYAYNWCSTPVDIDGDGKMDIAVGTALSGYVTFLRNQTSSPGAPINFTLEPTIVPFGVFVRDLTSADVDNDGDTDLIGVEIAGSSVFVLLNQTPQGGVAGGVASGRGRPRGSPPPLPIDYDATGDGAVSAADVAIMLERLDLPKSEVRR